YLSTRTFRKSEGDYVVANKRKILSSQQPAERATYQGATDRTTHRAAHRFAEIGNDPADHLVGDRARNASRDDLTGRHPAARYVGPENRPDHRADLPENSPASGRPVRGRRGSGHALLQHLRGGFGVDCGIVF